MIKIEGKYYRLISFQEYWFINDKDKIKKNLGKNGNIFIYQSNLNLNNLPKGILKKEFNTGIIDLEQDLENILKSFSQTTRNEIKKIIRLISGENVSGFDNKNINIQVKYFDKFQNGGKNEEIIEFIDFYNKFAKTKGLSQLKGEILKKYLNNILISKVLYNGKTILYHIYLKDDEEKILRLLYSASLFRLEENKNYKKLIGWLNNYHHYKDIEYGKNNGYKIYDLGGLFLGETGDDINLIQQKKVTNFKLKFKPRIITQYHYIKESKIYSLLKSIYLKINKIGTSK